MQKLLSLTWSHLFVFVFIFITPECESIKVFLWFMYKCVFPMFSSKNFIVSSLAFGLAWWLRWYRIHLQCPRPKLNFWVMKIPWRREWLPTPVFLTGEFHGQRRLGGYSPWGGKESDKTEWLILSLSLLLIESFIFSNSSWFCLRKLYLSKNMSVPSRLSILLACSCS